MAQEIKNVEYGLEKIFEGAQDFLPLLGTDYVEFYVGNAKQAAHYYKTAFGFQSYAYKGLETGSKEYASYVLAQNKIRIVLTTPLNSGSVINQHIVKHGDGVKIIALWVEDARKSWEETTKRGAKSFMEPTVEKDEFGEVVRSGALRLEALWPPPELLPGPPPPGADPNQLAVVLLARWHRFSMLLTADAEAGSVPFDPGPVDVLKVAHHGSEDAGLAALLARTRPRLAVISVGAGNPYGHPAAATLATLGGHGVRTLRTDRDGTVVIEVGRRGFGVADHG